MAFGLFRSKKKDARRQARRGRSGPSIITADVVIDGHLVSGGELQIDGTVHGDIRARGVVIDIDGVVQGEVAAEEVIVRGRVIGHIRGVHVSIVAGGYVEGDVIHETVAIENGAHVDGGIHRTDDPMGARVDAAHHTFGTQQIGYAEPHGHDHDDRVQPLLVTPRDKAAE